MEKIEFKSQICTTKEQSERLLALGLNKETADCALHFDCVDIDGKVYYRAYEIGHKCCGVPAWSLHRLIDMLPHVIAGLVISADGKEIKMFCYLRITKGEVAYWYYNEDGIVECYERFGGADLYKNVIDIIEFLISENLFQKDYMVQ